MLTEIGVNDDSYEYIIKSYGANNYILVTKEMDELHVYSVNR